MLNIIEKNISINVYTIALPFHEISISIKVLYAIENVTNAFASLHLGVPRAHFRKLQSSEKGA